MASSQKKGPGADNKIHDPLDPSLSLIPEFNSGYSEKTPARAIFKVARKGKNKSVSIELATELDSTRKGDFVKPPQHQ
jgi:hypothetical protein